MLEVENDPHTVQVTYVRGKVKLRKSMISYMHNVWTGRKTL
jgi:hypothetical protein